MKPFVKSDGLAMSSRNQRLSEEARLDAVVIYESIQGLKNEWSRVSDQ